ncbi:MAG: hypothetical protein HC860_19850 [Alkalinema sp. RU_4_3]|nr:hypothetical protein [Alkalinema sp. RU_4_3]
MSQRSILILSLTALLFAPTPSLAKVYDPADDNVCHMTLKGKSTSLNRLCGVKPPVKPVDLSIDRDRDGIPDELLAAVQDYRAQLRSNNRREDYETLERRFEQRLPYSDRVRQIKGQIQGLYQQYVGTKDSKYQNALIAMRNQLQKEMDSDPTYKVIQSNIYKVNRHLSRRR